MSKGNKIYYSFVSRDGYLGDAPSFYDNAEFNWVKEIEEKSSEVLSELNLLLSDGTRKRSYFDKKIVKRPGSWKTIPLFWWGAKFFKNTSKTPVTTSLLERIPGMVSASFNLLEPNAEILPHNGDTDAIVRCHLGLVIPSQLPDAGFEVNGESRSWESKKLLMFSDAHIHRAWNYSAEERVVLLLDIVLPSYIGKKRRVSSRVLASLFFQSISQKLKFLRKMPKEFQMLLYWCGAFFAWFLVPLRNAIGKLFF